MAKKQRLTAIRRLEKLRESRVLTYLTADRGLVNVPVAEDVVRLVYRHLQGMGKVPRLDLLIYSRGGDTNVPWPLVSLCRSFGEEFNVLVPYRAHSAATLVAMGADTIVMGPLAELTQVDPSLRTDYTPANPAQAGQTLMVSVEDLRGYFDFFQKTVGLKPDQLGPVIQLLGDKLHPLALGQVHRAYGSIGYIAERLLATHINDEAEAKKIATAMVSEMYVHSHKVKQPEATRIGLPATEATSDVATAVWKIYELYEKDMELNTPIRPSSVFPDVWMQYVELSDQRMVYIESTERTDVYLMDVVISRALQQVQTQTVQGQQGQPAPTTSRPIWGPSLTFATERELWSTE